MTDHEKEEAAIRLIVSGMTAEQILSYGEVYAFFREHFNNEMIDIIEADEKPSMKGFKSDKLMHFNCMSDFKENFIEPLCWYIEENSDLKFINHYGPSGLNSNFIIEFLDKDEKEISFFFYPSDYSSGEISVWTTPKEKSNYKPGTIGYMNQGNINSELIPDTITIKDLISKYFTYD